MAEVLVNIGCGQVAHPAWLNLDSHPAGPHVRRCDLRRGLPCETGSVAMCYSSHVVEHLSPREAVAFLAEQHRALMPGGIIRVVVPDLETICANLVRFADESRRGIAGAEDRLAYTYLELFDQTVRTRSGGELLAMWRACPAGLEEFVTSRSGAVLPTVSQPTATSRPGFATRLARAWRRAREAALAAFGFGLFGSSGWRAVREGLFRQRGEIHRAMYDEVRLARMLETAGFRDVRRVGPTESGLPGFDTYELDAVNGRARKPDSMYLEARR